MLPLSWLYRSITLKRLLIAGLLGGKKAKRKLPKKLAAASSSSRGTSGAVGVKSGKGKAKGRRITMGEDSIRIPE